MRQATLGAGLLLAVGLSSLGCRTSSGGNEPPPPEPKPAPAPAQQPGDGLGKTSAKGLGSGTSGPGFGGGNGSGTSAHGNGSGTGAGMVALFKASNGMSYPYCTNGTNNGSGWGWQPGLAMAPNGGSCKAPGDTMSTPPPTPSTFLASDGKTYPYCTNGTNNGTGWGWQPGLANAPNGGSCKSPGTSGMNDSPSSTYKASNGLVYAYCASSSNNTGRGWGWQPGITPSPNGGSCKTPGAVNPSDATSPTWCDPYKVNVCYPYCTNGNDGGNGFGWQPSLQGAPNGGSCRVPGA